MYVSPSVVSSRVLASSTTATLTTLNYTQHSKVTWDWVSINYHSAPLHCSTGNSLLLNPDKSDVTFYGTRPGLKRVDPINSVTVAGCAITISDRLKILGVTLDATLSFDEHIATVVKACNYHLRALCHIRRCITQDIASTIACSIVGSRIDYCNELLFGASGKAFNHL